jgi:hypothetical protein
MAVVRTTGQKLLGYLDHPRCCGPFPVGENRVKFGGTRIVSQGPRPHGQTPYEPIVEDIVIDIEAWHTLEGDVLLFIQSYDEDFIKSLPGFTPITP